MADAREGTSHEPRAASVGSVREVALLFLKLGTIAFGGPAAHTACRYPGSSPSSTTLNWPRPPRPIPFWCWPAGVAMGAMPTMAALVSGKFGIAFMSILGIVSAVGLGRAVLRRNLMARGIRVDG